MTFDKLKSRKRETIETADEHNLTWEIKKLGEVCQVQRGLTYSGKDTVDISDQVVLRATNIDLGTGKLIFDELKYLREDLEIKPVYALKKDSLLICFSSGSKSHLGKIALIEDDYPNFYFGGFIGQITPSDKIDSKYLFYYLSTEAYKVYISNLTDGVNINNLKVNDLKSFEIPLPPLPEQQRIVAILDETFSAIDKAKANAEQNLQNAKELFESYLQGVFASTGSATKRESWEERKIKDIGFAQTGTTPKTAEKENYGDYIPFIKPADVDFLGIGDIRYDNQGLSEIGLKKGRKMESGSILMVCIGATIGKVGFTEREVSCNQQINSLTVKKEFEPKFIYYAMTSREFQGKVLLEGKGAQATLPIINKTKWENLTISFPKSLKEQQTIVRQLDALRAETQKLEAVYQKKIDDLEELKKSILQKAFAGELRSPEGVASANDGYSPSEKKTKNKISLERA